MSLGGNIKEAGGKLLDFAAAKEGKQLQDFHAKFMEDLKKTDLDNKGRLAEVRKTGYLDGVGVGEQFHTPHSIKNNKAPYKVLAQGWNKKQGPVIYVQSGEEQHSIAMSKLWELGGPQPLGIQKAVEGGLGESTGARKARAEQLGFDITKTYFHGAPASTPAGLERFTGKRGVAGHFTKNPAFADMFALGEGGKVLPVHLRVKDTFDINNPAHQMQIVDLVDEQIIKLKSMRGKTGSDRVEEVKKMPGIPPWAIRNMERDTDTGLDFLIQSLEDKVRTIESGNADFGTLESLLHQIKSEGFDSYVDYESPGTPTGIAVFDKNNIKSVNAQFREADSGNIMTGGAGAAVTGAAAASGSDQAEAGTLGTLESESDQIASDEGERKNSQGRHVSYLDTRNLLTGGRGHLMTPAERKKYPEGTPIPDDVVEKWWKEDVEKHSKDMKVWDKAIPDMPDEARKILFNMIFNMGPTKFNPDKWPGLTKALKAKDYKGAGDAMQDSAWFGQVGDRSKRLISRMQRIRD